MTAISIVADLGRRGIRFRVDGDRLRFAPRDALTPAELAILRAHKAALLAHLSGSQPGDDRATPRGPAWPELRLAGVVYLEHGFRASLPAAARPACPPPGGSGQACEHTTAGYWPGR